MDGAAVTAFCEIGPVSVRRLGGGTGSVASAEAAAALDGGDDPLVLLGGRAVAVEELWRTVLEPLLRGIDDSVLVHPSWWPTTRVAAVTAIARQLCDSVTTRSRSWFLAPDDVVVEIAPHLVAVCGGGTLLSVQSRSGAPAAVADAVARTVLGQTGGRPVWLDGPAGVPGAHILAGMIGNRLRAVGHPVRRVDDRQIFRAAREALDHGAVPDTAHPGRRRIAALLCAVLTSVVAAGVWSGIRVDRTSPIAPTALVEGRVTMEIPAGWPVQRITAGPGSARVQVRSPTDDQTALHLTQSRVRDEDLAASATVLRRAFDSQPAGVFVDFHPSDVRAGRPAVTYREVRAGHDIRWAVILDGAVRISIGCQSAAGAEQHIAAACEQAVRSAHEIH
jgi:type VII secretion-associated protein (TIGR03931 family)